jgi:hypothetical protein
MIASNFRRVIAATVVAPVGLGVAVAFGAMPVAHADKIDTMMANFDKCRSDGGTWASCCASSGGELNSKGVCVWISDGDDSKPRPAGSVFIGQHLTGATRLAQ